ncbi:MAG: membrane protein YqaA with SNARE-associated domain [Halieaceae bacterium]|jgi:membrane protein YqaA with SNARE-associated domain
MEWIEFGYLGMFTSSILAATLLPFGSEAVFLGLLYAKFDTTILIGVAGVGNTIGGMITYYMGRLGKWNWLEKWFGINAEKIDRHMDTIRKYGWLVCFFTWLPGIGDPLAAAIGFARIPPLVAGIWMLIGKTSRFIFISVAFKYGMEIW